MNKDLQLFMKVINRLVFLTTRDEYGSSRSRGIETLCDLHEDLNEQGIVPSRGYWTENSLKLFLHRVKQRYCLEIVFDESDAEFIGRSAWEYTSYTRREEIVRGERTSRDWRYVAITQTYPLNSYQNIDGELWKDHEIKGIKNEHNQLIKKCRHNFQEETPEKHLYI